MMEWRGNTKPQSRDNCRPKSGGKTWKTMAEFSGSNNKDNNRSLNMSEIKKTGLDLMREEFPAHHISKLPKGSKQQNECPASEKVNCKVCGGWHHPKIIHLDYVGHAALTDRLLDCDPHWSWDPLALGSDGYPAVDKDGGMWIKLTVCGITRLGYGDAQGKTGGNAVKERIGDALRNAAMRFGAALELWHKGELHLPEEEEPAPKKEHEPKKLSDKALQGFLSDVASCLNTDSLSKVRDDAKAACEEANDAAAYGAVIVAVKTKAAELAKKEGK